MWNVLRDRGALGLLSTNTDSEYAGTPRSPFALIREMETLFLQLLKIGGIRHRKARTAMRILHRSYSVSGKRLTYVSFA